MRILLLGGSGHIGSHLFKLLSATPWAAPVCASRSSKPDNQRGEFLQLDTRNKFALMAALEECDAVVNCVAGSATAITEGARMLTQAALATQCRVIHLSTMSVYGRAEGEVAESANLDPGLGWYGRAKCHAENDLEDFSRDGGKAVVLRLGCVYGPGSELWVGRIGRWLLARRLGDLGVEGDGWSNLVHVDDVCQAVIAALQLPLKPGELTAFNLAAPDSPRWNEYFVDMALALNATPVERLSPNRVKLDALFLGPLLKCAEIGQKRIGWPKAKLPDALPPGLVRLWAQQIHLDSKAASQALRLQWTPYERGLKSSVNWFEDKYLNHKSLAYKIA